MSNVRPGQQIRLVSNHFKMTVQNKGLIFIYSVDFGTIEPELHSTALRSTGDALRGLIGNFI